MKNIFVKYGTDGRNLAKDVMQAAQAEKVIKRGSTVVIKPNLVVAKPSSSGATTDPEVVAGIVEFISDLSCSKLTIAEGSWIGDSTRKAFAQCGYNSLAKRYGLQLLDLKHDRTTKCRRGDLELDVCCTPLEADVLINVPVLKAHCQTKMTCALKNLKGCIPDGEKRRFHALGLHHPIAVLSQVLAQHFIVVDGLIGDLTFEEGGTPVAMNRVYGGTDPVSIDAYSSSLLGYAPEDIPYLVEAADLGVGTLQADIVELNQGEASSFSVSSRAAQLRKYVCEKQACSACLGSLLHALERLGETPSRAKPLYIGQGFRKSNGGNSEGLGIGECTSGFPRFVPGCPPLARDIIQFLREE